MSKSITINNSYSSVELTFTECECGEYFIDFVQPSANGTDEPITVAVSAGAPSLKDALIEAALMLSQLRQRCDELIEAMGGIDEDSDEAPVDAEAN